MGFTEEDVTSRSDRLIDAVVAWGPPDQVQARLQAHRDAGADHVCIQPLSPAGPRDLDWNALEALSPNG
jgi:hypothetical protein